MLFRLILSAFHLHRTLFLYFAHAPVWKPSPSLINIHHRHSVRAVDSLELVSTYFLRFPQRRYLLLASAPSRAALLISDGPLVRRTPAYCLLVGPGQQSSPSSPLNATKRQDTFVCLLACLLVLYCTYIIDSCPYNLLCLSGATPSD